jgi:hypothetical protein
MEPTIVQALRLNELSKGDLDHLEVLDAFEGADPTAHIDAETILLGLEIQAGMVADHLTR